MCKINKVIALVHFNGLFKSKPLKYQNHKPHFVSTTHKSLSLSLPHTWKAKYLRDPNWRTIKAMAFLLLNLSPSLLLHHKSREKSFSHPSFFPNSNPNSHSHFLPPLSLTSTASFTSLQSPPPLQDVAQVNTPPGEEDKHQKDDFYVNLGLAVRTLREDLPLLFTNDLNYDIYRWFSRLGISYSLF